MITPLDAKSAKTQISFNIKKIVNALKEQPNLDDRLTILNDICADLYATKAPQALISMWLSAILLIIDLQYDGYDPLLSENENSK